MSTRSSSMEERPRRRWPSERHDREGDIWPAGASGGCRTSSASAPASSRTRVGYTGGDVANATYRNHGTHAEAIEITFDPSVTSYREILEFFFQIHDPTTKNRQGNDVGAELPLGDLLRRRRAEAGGRGHHRRRRGLRALARQGRDRGRRRRGRSGRRSPSTRTTWSTTPTGTRATSLGRAGSCPGAATPWPGRTAPWPTSPSTQRSKPSGDGCVECLATDGWWFHLRRCAACGHIGCCDSSPSQHASKHAKEDGHSIVRSFEPGEDWFWDYADPAVLRRPRAGAARAPPAQSAHPGPGRPRPGGLGAPPPLRRRTS